MRFGDLLDVDGDNVRQLIEDANRDIEARQNLGRVLKGVEVALRVAGFGAAAAAKVAASSMGVPLPIPASAEGSAGA